MRERLFALVMSLAVAAGAGVLARSSAAEPEGLGPQVAASSASSPLAPLDPSTLRRAEAIVRQHVAIDAHAHDPFKPASPVFPRQVTLPMMVQEKLGGLVQTVPFSPLPSERPVETILADLRRVKAELEADGRVALALTSADFARIRRTGRPAMMLGVEYFQGLLEARVETLETYYREGVRIVGLSHNGKDVVTDGEGASRTLTAFGRQVIATMNTLGIACDVTHVPDTIRRQVIAASRAPILLSHSAALTLVPSPFNVADDTLDQLAVTNGLIGVTFCSEQLSKETFAQKSQVQDPTRLPPARAEDIVDQIDYLRKRVGLDFVALGSDFGGSGRMAPTGLETAGGLPLIAYHMLKRGYAERDIIKVLGGNFVRFMERVERAAASAPK
jgi:membrane dipeptidase